MTPLAPAGGADRRGRGGKTRFLGPAGSFPGIGLVMGEEGEVEGGGGPCVGWAVPRTLQPPPSVSFSSE